LIWPGALAPHGFYARARINRFACRYLSRERLRGRVLRRRARGRYWGRGFGALGAPLGGGLKRSCLARLDRGGA